MAYSRIPVLIVVFFAVDFALIGAHLFNVYAGQPIPLVTGFLDVRRENNLPSWYSSMQWFCVASLFGIFAYHHFSLSRKKSWLLAALPLLFLMMSLDEVAIIHERLGVVSDRLLAAASRKGTLFDRTGIWMFVLGGPFIVFFAGLILSLRIYFRRAPGAFLKVVLGMAVMLIGALGIETLDNWRVIGSDVWYRALQASAEELCEMLGGTIILWGGYELLQRYGFAWRLDHLGAHDDPYEGEAQDAK